MIGPTDDTTSMKIEHITYEESRSGKPSLKHDSTTQKVKHYLSFRLPHQTSQDLVEDSRTTNTERSTTMWPNTADSPAKLTAYLPEQSSTLSENLGNKGISLNSGFESEPELRRKPNFTDSLRDRFRSQLGARDLNLEKRESGKRTLAKAQNLRSSIREGKLEKVVPPGNYPAIHQRQAPPRPLSSTKPFYGSKNSSTTSSKVSSEVLEYLRTSADILDETRRELTGKYKPTFENLYYCPSFSLPRPDNTNANERELDESYESSSDESFCCVGESARLSGDGTELWSDGPPKTCRLCYKACVGGRGGLCKQCRLQILRPKTLDSDSSGAWSSGCRSEEDAVKPTPPLKDRKYLSMELEHMSPTSVHTREELPPIPSEKSMKAKNPFEYDDENDKFRRWQTISQRREFEDSREHSSRWSTSYTDGTHYRDYGYDVAHDDHTPLTPMARKDVNTLPR